MSAIRKDEHPVQNAGCSFVYVAKQMQCSGTVRIIAPSGNDGNVYFGAINSLFKKFGLFNKTSYNGSAFFAYKMIQRLKTTRGF